MILAIDQGTSSTKCLLVDDEGAIVNRASAPVDVAYPKPGWVEQSADEVWDSVVTAVRACVGTSTVDAISTVGISSQRESALLWDRRTGEPVGPLLGWQDQRTAAHAHALKGNAALVRQISGLPLDPMFTALKAHWLLGELHGSGKYESGRHGLGRHGLGRHSGDYRLGTVDSWLIHKLTGEHRIEAGNASRTQLYDVRRNAWSDELLELFGVPRSILPEVVPSDAPASIVDGPLRGVPVHAVLGDSHAALFAHGAWTPGMVKATYGTGSSVMGLVEDHEALDDGLCLTIAWQAGGRVAYAAEGNIRASGAVLVWLAALLGSTPEEILELAGRSDSGGTVLVPAFGGLAAPWWDDGAVAGWTGLTLGSRREHLARAAVEAIAFQVGAVAGRIPSLDGVYADGGGSASDLLMQLQADVSRVPVHRAKAVDLSALGAAHLAGLGAGIWDEARLANLPRERDTFAPGVPVPAEAWTAALDRFR
jgi:glycerol kinase